MTEDELLVTADGAVRILTLNRPRRRNALGLVQGRQLLAALTDADNDPDCRCVLLAGTGKTFCAGGDIEAMADDEAGIPSRMAEYNDLARALIDSTKPRIAAVNGGAFGLGLSLAVACDYVVSAADALFVASFGRVGLVPDTGLSWTLPRRVGIARAKSIALFAEDVRADEAVRIGLVDEVVAPADVFQVALKRAHQLAAAPPATTAGVKRLFAQSESDLETLLNLEAECQIKLLMSPEFAAAKAAFLDRSTKSTAPASIQSGASDRE